MTTEELKKSVNSVLHERMTSPFWGALIASWLAWNWKFIYFTLFVSSNSLSISKYEYVQANFDTGVWNFLIIPFGISLLIMGIVPFLSSRVYWVNLLFEKWKIEKRIKVDNETPLTIKDSVALRSELLRQYDKFNDLNRDKDERIIKLTDERDQLVAEISNLKDALKEKNEQNKILEKDLERRKKRNDFTTIFRGELMYEVIDHGKQGFYVSQMDRFFFDDNRVAYIGYVLTRGGRNNLRFALYPENHNEKKDYNIFLVDIRREKGTDYYGTQIKIEKKDGTLIVNKQEIKIYE